MDGSFHSPEWHAARLASLQTSHTVTWEEWKQKQKVSFSPFSSLNYFLLEFAELWSTLLIEIVILGNVKHILVSLR
jgi:hypothetical protein